jgi:phytoene desaturase (3,4-didehydrolycopene-forming)
VNILKRDSLTGTMLMRYGTYFINGDPTLFEVILQYLGTGCLPLFFDSTMQTHDLAKYAALLGEACYF